MENLLNIRETAFILKVHPLTVRRYIKEGELKAIKIGGNIRIKEAQMAVLANRNSVSQICTFEYLHPYLALQLLPADLK